MTAHHHSGESGLYGLKLMVGGLAIAFVLLDFNGNRIFLRLLF